MILKTFLLAKESVERWLSQWIQQANWYRCSDSILSNNKQPLNREVYTNSFTAHHAGARNHYIAPCSSLSSINIVNMSARNVKNSVERRAAALHVLHVTCCWPEENSVTLCGARSRAALRKPSTFCGTQTMSNRLRRRQESLSENNAQRRKPRYKRFAKASLTRLPIRGKGEKNNSASPCIVPRAVSVETT